MQDVNKGLILRSEYPLFCRTPRSHLKAIGVALLRICYCCDSYGSNHHRPLTLSASLHSIPYLVSLPHIATKIATKPVTMVLSAAEKLQAILNGPAQRPPPGVQPNFANPGGMTYAGYVALGTIVSVCTLVFAIHIFTQICIIRRFAWEDGFLVLAWVSLSMRE